MALRFRILPVGIQSCATLSLYTSYVWATTMNTYFLREWLPISATSKLTEATLIPCTGSAPSETLPFPPTDRGRDPESRAERHV
jgi:hypothetical protein